MPTKPAPRPSKPSAYPVRDAADALFRTARESCHQHERLTRILAHGAEETEFRAVCEVAVLCDRFLAEQMALYEASAAAGRGREPEDWWHAANALWMASREYGHRQAGSDSVGARFKRHSAAQLGEITMEYELELSARMALKQAITAYAALRPDAN